MATKKVTFYEMALVFGIDTGLKDLDDILNAAGLPDLVAENAFELTIKQTISIIPSSEMLRQYEEAIKTNLAHDGLSIKGVHFLRYDYVNPIEKEIDNTTEQEEDT